VNATKTSDTGKPSCVVAWNHYMEGFKKSKALEQILSGRRIVGVDGDSGVYPRSLTSRSARILGGCLPA